MNPLDLLYRYEPLGAPDASGVYRSRYTPWGWRRLLIRMWIEALFEWWECDMCDRVIWSPLLSRHEMTHTDAEWAAAGYDKAGTVRGPLAK
jgi:hypothetical protein